MFLLEQRRRILYAKRIRTLFRRRLEDKIMLKCVHKNCQYPDCEKTCGLNLEELIAQLQVENKQLRQELFNLNTNISLVRLSLRETKTRLLKCYPSINKYTLTCPHGFMDCVYDPAYLKEYCFDWWKELGMPTSCENCKNGERYDDEDK